ncbi:hypothetical protein PIB30_033637 [Stylosanthes scabra]|uniref:Uncharacterized protein n=1 Tax=Stylosanthes scabra TaxID=79078 RepID=A0ABU6SCD2_9FABA|nr:hypothetical protein [Stylosanthes scabra]
MPRADKLYKIPAVTGSDLLSPGSQALVPYCRGEPPPVFVIETAGTTRTRTMKIETTAQTTMKETTMGEVALGVAILTLYILGYPTISNPFGSGFDTVASTLLTVNVPISNPSLRHVLTQLLLDVFVVVASLFKVEVQTGVPSVSFEYLK